MPRASSILGLLATVAMAAAAPAVELPVIVSQVVQAKPQPVSPPPAKLQLPVITNYPSAAMQSVVPKGNIQLPVIVPNPARPWPAMTAPVRVAVAYPCAANDYYVGPVAYNAYCVGPLLGLDAGLNWGLCAPWWGGVGCYGGCGYYGGYGYGDYVYSAFAPVAPWGLGLQPPRFEILDTGVRPNAGHLTSMPSVWSPVYSAALCVYRR